MSLLTNNEAITRREASLASNPIQASAEDIVRQRARNIVRRASQPDPRDDGWSGLHIRQRVAREAFVHLVKQSQRMEFGDPG